MDEQSNNTNMGGSVPANMSGGSSGDSAGPIIGIIVILAIIILGGLYFWNQLTDNLGMMIDDETMMHDDQVNQIKAQSGADDTASIEADLNATDVDNLDAELNAS